MATDLDLFLIKTDCIKTLPLARIKENDSVFEVKGSEHFGNYKVWATVDSSKEGIHANGWIVTNIVFEDVWLSLHAALQDLGKAILEATKSKRFLDEAAKTIDNLIG